MSQTVFVVGGSFYEMGFNDFTWLIFGMTIAVHRLYERSSFYRPTGASRPVGTRTTSDASTARAAPGKDAPKTRGMTR